MALATITGGGSFTRQNIADLNNNFAALAGGFTPGNIIYCNPAATGVSSQDGSVDAPYTSLLDAYAAGRNGYNDVIVLVGNGAASGSARLSANMTWAKDALHLVGVSSGVNISNRSRIAPTSGVTAFTTFFTVSGNGCLFQNIEWFQGFATGVAASICVTVTGGRNLFQDCHIAGMGDDASAQSTTSRCLKISGTGENQFVNCTIGVDTVARTVANASVELASGTPRNDFIGCTFALLTTSADALCVLGAAAGCIDRFSLIKDPVIAASLVGGGIAITGFVKLAASAGGYIIIANPISMGVTTWGYDATTDAQVKIIGPVTPANGALIGLGVTPAA